MTIGGGVGGAKEAWNIYIYIYTHTLPPTNVAFVEKYLEDHFPVSGTPALLSGHVSGQEGICIPPPD